jgi:hypothetical protein
MTDPDSWMQVLAEQVTPEDCQEAASTGAYAVADLVERGARIAIATELRSIAAAFNEWHEEGAAKLARGEHTHKALVRSYAVRDGLLDRAAEVEAR